jgi:hypothetical protein
LRTTIIKLEKLRRKVVGEYDIKSPISLIIEGDTVGETKMDDPNWEKVCDQILSKAKEISDSLEKLKCFEGGKGIEYLPGGRKIKAMEIIRDIRYAVYKRKEEAKFKKMESLIQEASEMSEKGESTIEKLREFRRTYTLVAGKFNSYGKDMLEQIETGALKKEEVDKIINQFQEIWKRYENIVGKFEVLVKKVGVSGEDWQPSRGHTYKEIRSLYEKIVKKGAEADE